jgi:hypothetical protein
VGRVRHPQFYFILFFIFYFFFTTLNLIGILRTLFIPLAAFWDFIP